MQHFDNKQSTSDRLVDPWAVMVNPDQVNGRGLFEREQHKGYTLRWEDAGRFTKEEALATAAASGGKYQAIPLPYPVTTKDKADGHT